MFPHPTSTILADMSLSCDGPRRSDADNATPFRLSAGNVQHNRADAVVLSEINLLFSIPV